MTRNSQLSPEDKQYAWTGLWELDKTEMAWKRSRAKRTKVGRAIGLEEPSVISGPVIRTPNTYPINDLGAKLIVVRSHPDTPEALSPGQEGIWLDIESTANFEVIDRRVACFGVHAIRDLFEFDPDFEETEITPERASPVTFENSEPLDPNPLVLRGLKVLVQPGSLYRDEFPLAV